MDFIQSKLTAVEDFDASLIKACLTGEAFGDADFDFFCHFGSLFPYLTMLPKVTITPTVTANESNEPMISARLMTSCLVVCGCM